MSTRFGRLSGTIHAWVFFLVHGRTGIFLCDQMAYLKELQRVCEHVINKTFPICET